MWVIHSRTPPTGILTCSGNRPRTPSKIMAALTDPLMGLGLKFMLSRFAKLLESDYAPARAQ